MSVSFSWDCSASGASGIPGRAIRRRTRGFQIQRGWRSLMPTSVPSKRRRCRHGTYIGMPWERESACTMTPLPIPPSTKAFMAEVWIGFSGRRWSMPALQISGNSVRWVGSYDLSFSRQSLTLATLVELSTSKISECAPKPPMQLTC